MKKLAVLIFFAFTLYANGYAQLVDVIVEEYGTGGGNYPDGFMTYRVYARLQDPTDFLSAVYGIGASPEFADHALTIGTVPGTSISTQIWNSEYGGLTAPDINPAFCGFFPELCYDSYITIGRENSNSAGSVINVLTTPANGFHPSFGIVPFGTVSSVNDGSWFGLTGDSNCFPTGDDNRILIMQITCPVGELAYAINLQIFDEGLGANSLYYCHTTEEGPGFIGGVLEQDYTCMGLVYPFESGCPACNDPSACNYSPEATNNYNCIYFEDCETQIGCMNPSACNYEELAIYEVPFSCTFPGCMDPDACNYDFNAACDDGSCYTPADLGYISGTLFFDINGDGWWGEDLFSEPSIGSGSLYFEELGISLFPSSEGEFSMNNFPFGTYTVSYNDPNGVYELNGGVPMSITLPTCDYLLLGLDAINNTSLFVSGPEWNNQNFHCTNGFNVGVWLENLGSVPLNGSFVMSFDPLLVPQYLSYAIPFDSYDNGVMTWNINDQPPGATFQYICHINGPGSEFLGEVFPFDMEMVLFDDQGNVIYEFNWLYEPTVVCAYDPNDKYTAEPGYTEEHHFVPQEDEIEYRVRFQNTGNFPAETVIIRDTLDVQHLDLESFYPVFGSHSFSTIVESNGAVTFTFSNIMLPDSASDEPGSQGYVVYRVRPHSEVQHMDVIHNTAYIFFDGNPAIVTNTTWHTIMDCNELGTITGPEMICEGEMAEFTFPDDFVETIDWTVNEDEAGSGTPLQYSADTPGEFVVGVTVLNPLCEISQNTNLEVKPLPGTVITLGDGILAAPEGASWQWYYEDAELVGETSQTLSLLYSGYYTVLTTSEDGCTSLAEIIFITITDPSAANLRFYPNPVSGSARLDMPGMENSSVLLYDASGKLVRNWVTSDSSEWLDFSDMPNGTYNLVLSTQDKIVGTMPVVVAR